MGIHFRVVNLTKRETLPVFAKLGELTLRERAAIYLLSLEAPPNAGLVGRWCGDQVALVTDPHQLKGVDGTVPGLPSPYDVEEILEALLDHRYPVLPLDEVVASVQPVLTEVWSARPDLSLLATSVRKLRNDPLLGSRVAPCDLDGGERLDPGALVRTHGVGPLWQDLSGTNAPRAFVQLLALGGRWCGHRVAVRSLEACAHLADATQHVWDRDVVDDARDFERAWSALDDAAGLAAGGRVADGARRVGDVVPWVGSRAGFHGVDLDLAAFQRLAERAAAPGGQQVSAGEVLRAVDALRGLVCVVG